MRKIIILTAISILNISNVFGQCSSLFSFGAYFETVTFINQSSVSNAHYYWNFGDGTSSSLINPTHKFPDTGNYFVTLFAKDTVSNCSSYYEYWINVTKFSTDLCQSSINDSVFSYNGNDYVSIIDNSANCSGYNKYISCAGTAGFPLNIWISLTGIYHGRLISRALYVDTGYIAREAYKSTLYNYSNAKNYGGCSANFEFSTVSQDSLGERILFKAMNKNATFYEWVLVGFGDPIISNNDTLSQYYPYSNSHWLVGLKTTGALGCNDTLFQQIRVEKNTLTYTGVKEIENKINFRLFPNPFSNQATLQFSNLQQKTSFTLYNVNGQTVKSIKNIDSDQIIIDRNNLASGLYYFVLTTDNKIVATGNLVAE